jgi:hypothetical protein
MVHQSSSSDSTIASAGVIVGSKRGSAAATTRLVELYST